MNYTISKIFRHKVILLLPLFVLTSVEIGNFVINKSIYNYLQPPSEQNQASLNGDIGLLKRYGYTGIFISDLSRFQMDHNFSSDLESELHKANDYSGSKNGIPKNLIVIQVESMDALAPVAEVEGTMIMPNLNMMRSKSIFVPKIGSFHGAGGSSDAEFAILNGIPPLTQESTFRVTSYDYPNSLIHVLNQSGYSTMAFHGNKKDFFNRSYAYKKMGFKMFYDNNDMAISSGKWGALDENVFNASLRLMKSEPSPFFSYIITLTSHAPYNWYKQSSYTPPFRIASKQIQTDYLNSMSYVDKQLSKFIDSVMSTIPNTVIAILGDHTPGDIGSDPFVASIDRKLNIPFIEKVPLFFVTNTTITCNLNNDDKRSQLDVGIQMLYFSGLAFQYKSQGKPYCIE